MVPSRHIVRNTLVNLHGTPCSEPLSTVEDYVSHHPVLARVPSEGFRLIGETLGRSFYIVSEPGMKLISSLTTALHEFHEDGICVSSFDESNLVVSNDTREMLFHPIKPHKIKLPQNLPTDVFVSPGLSVFPDTGRLKFRDVEFEQSSPTGIRANYLDAHAFITKKLLQPEIPAPDDIKHLLKLMKSPESATMGPLLSRHASVVCMGQRLGLAMTYIPYIRQLLPCIDQTAEAMILKEMPYLDDWTERAKKNKLLELFFNHRPDKTRVDAAGFLDFYYYVSINRMKWCRSHWFKPGGGYTPDEIETVKTLTYPELMPTIQEALWRMNHLEKAHVS
ncbi:hypothetical protein HU200_025418 [Digitaria exilis]|uniref:Uncharacterized protein n=1 Tax=Digitaria exilis TaxID=1010633 RepID=A0A835C4J4_9POAL|nr:hypothetical protein HU200_025418 [Digitaria exilis]